MESLGKFARSVQHRDHMIYMDVEKGYRHLTLHSAMRDGFMFRYAGRYYQCVAFLFGWGRSPLWCTRLMAPFVTKLRAWGYRVLPYIDDFLIISIPSGRVVGKVDCVAARPRIEHLITLLGLSRHKEKREWEGSQVVEHLGVRVHSNSMRFYVVTYKAQRMRKLARDLLKQVRLGRRGVSVGAARSFCESCISLMITLPSYRVYTRALHWYISTKRARDKHGRCRLLH